MADLTAADVTIILPAQQRNFVRSPSKQFVLADLTFGDGVDTYPVGGVPLPDKAQFGFKKSIDFGAIEQPPANGFIYKYDRANHKIKIFTQGITTGSTAAADSVSGALVEDSADAETAVRAMGTAIDTTYDLGAMKEMANSIAPAQVTLSILLIGQ